MPVQQAGSPNRSPGVDCETQHQDSLYRDWRRQAQIVMSTVIGSVGNRACSTLQILVGKDVTLPSHPGRGLWFLVGGFIDSNYGGEQHSYIDCQGPGRHRRPVGARRYLMPCIYSYYYLVDHRANAKEMLGIVVWCGRWSHTKDRMQRASILYEQALDGRLSPAHSFLLHRLKLTDK
jgi:hypothetical protein